MLSASIVVKFSLFIYISFFPDPHGSLCICIIAEGGIRAVHACVLQEKDFHAAYTYCGVLLVYNRVRRNYMKPIVEPVTQLHNRISVPTLGYRVISAHGNIYERVKTAVRAGYRHFDLSTEPEAEKEFTRALEDSGLNRGDVFLTVKIPNEDHGFEAAQRAFRHSLKRLHTDYADLLLIDWPNPKKFRDQYEEISVRTWAALESAYKSGAARAIGVANYEARHIEYVLEHSEIAPMVNEARIYPGFPFTDNLNCAREHRILTVGYMPVDYRKVLESREIGIFAEKYHATPEQICISYLFSKGCIALVYGDDEEQLRSNFLAYDLRLAEEDIRYLDVMKNYGPANINPDEADF